MILGAHLAGRTQLVAGHTFGTGKVTVTALHLEATGFTDRGIFRWTGKDAEVVGLVGRTREGRGRQVFHKVFVLLFLLLLLFLFL